MINRPSLVLVIIFIFSLSAFSQNILSVPVFHENRNWDESYWKTNNPDSNRVYFNKSDQLKIEIKSNTDSTLKRMEYYPSGNLKSVVAVFLENKIDTQYIEDETGHLTSLVFGNYADVFNGEYTEYADAPKGYVKTKGQYCKNIPSGEWVRHSATGAYEVCSYDSSGTLTGEYKSYYFTYENSPKKIKITGQYGQVRISEEGTDFEGYLIPAKFETRPIGLWKFYDTNGEIQGEIECKWKTNSNNK